MTPQAEDKAKEKLVEGEQRWRIEVVSNKISNKLNPKTIHNNPHEVKKSNGKFNNYI